MANKGLVLVVDDEQIVCERAKEHLSELGLEVETFTESQSAIDKLASQQFDLVVTDLKMKGPTGLDILHFVRQNHPGTEIIIITGYATMDAVREAEYSDVFKFIQKPFQMKDLGKLVQKAVRRAQRKRGKATS